ncbi:MAG: YbaK/EbsC family protein [Desulfovibrionaceae bacterium]|nr:YbaK/EbsC family protein [Desulfovibrionaceae bacterium]
MSIERARAALSAFGADGRILEFETSSATVPLAAQALGVEPGRIAKTLSYRLPEGTALIVAAGDARVDNKRFRARFQTKARMLSPEEAVERVGHAVGGVCPFGVNEGVSIWLDISLRRFATVFPACGSSNSAIELDMAELERFSNASGWVDVCSNWQSAPAEERPQNA